VHPREENPAGKARQRPDAGNQRKSTRLVDLAGAAALAWIHNRPGAPRRPHRGGWNVAAAVVRREATAGGNRHAGQGRRECRAEV